MLLTLTCCMRLTYYITELHLYKRSYLKEDIILIKEYDSKNRYRGIKIYVCPSYISMFCLLIKLGLILNLVSGLLLID